MAPEGSPDAGRAGPPERTPGPARTRWTGLRSASDAAWRILVVGALVLAIGAVLWKLRIVVLPIFIAMLLCSALAPLVVLLERRGWRTLAATWAVFLGFILIVGAVVAAVVPPTVAEFDTLTEAVDTGLDDVEEWLVDGPLNLDRAEVSEFTDDPGGRLAEMARSSGATFASGARLVGETLAGAILALVLTFLFLKDGRRFQAWALAHLPPEHRDLTRAAAGRAWVALGGFLRGAATLGIFEATVLGVTLWIVGAPLVAPVAILTFVAAFFPIVGAVVAGALAVLVALAGAGFPEAMIVLAVAIVVQQLDNDLLAPLIYGHNLRLHPAVILVVLTAGGVLGGIAGAFLAVPVTGALGGVLAEVWGRYGDGWVGDSGASPADPAEG